MLEKQVVGVRLRPVYAMTLAFVRAATAVVVVAITAALVGSLTMSGLWRICNVGDAAPVLSTRTFHVSARR
jgi:tetrahydromethanopterin S-methyltransferase subunit C